MPDYGGFMKFTSFVLAFLCSATTFATWQEDFSQLKSIPRSYQDAGAICEEVARLDMQKEYPAPQFTLINGIAYGDADRTIGELDVVVFDNNLHKVVRIAEVKCWRDLGGGLSKAHEQRQRFLKNLRSNKVLFFKSTSTQELFNQDEFEHVKEFITIGQKGSVAAGYDQELNYTLKELHGYTLEMISCQHKNECVRP